MASAYLLKNLPRLIGAKAVSVNGALYGTDPGNPTVELTFSEGTRFRADFWRLVTKGKPLLSSFDHQQKYGLPSPIDAIDELKREIHDQALSSIRFDEETGDLEFEFVNQSKFQAFNFTGYEVWEISYPDGTGEYSNYARG
jgi:hypothetical protein